MAAILDPLHAETGSTDGGQNITFPETIVDLKVLDSLSFSAIAKLEPDIPTGELSAAPLINSREEHSIPREVIFSNVSSALSTASLQAELMRPIIAGTFNKLPAYLLKLQFNFQTGSIGWNRRIQRAIINVVLEDAPNDPAADGADHPVLARCFPVGEGWQGPVSTATHKQEAGVRMGVGTGGVSTNTSTGLSLNHNVSLERKGTARITTLRTGGSSRNALRIQLTENPVSRDGIPYFVLLPVIIIHQSTRFRMRVTVRATFGFWHSNFAFSVPVLGKLDEPLFFDPGVLSKMREDKKRGADGTMVVDWLEDLQDVDLQQHSSLGRTTA